LKPIFFNHQAARMNYYVSLISGTINFVEANIQETLSLEDLAQEFNFSAFHFNRIFRSVTGRTLKQYILGRKLTAAMEKLETNTESIINIAFDFGFKSPEVFSRAFKKQFGISPHIYRQDRPNLEPVQKAVIVERDIINFQGQLALKGSEIYLNVIELEGVQIDINVNRSGFEKTLQSTSDTFYHKAVMGGRFVTDHFYALVNCLGEEKGDYRVFYGMETESQIKNEHSTTRNVPAGWYEKFFYTGDMFNIRLSFIDDLYRWVMVKEIELEMNGIGMLNIFKPDYPETHEVEILVPIKTPK
jgi:AraC family transcriptional regulator